MIWMRPTQLDQPVALGPKLGPPGLPKDLRGPQKGLSGPKRALLGAPVLGYFQVADQIHLAERIHLADEIHYRRT